MPLQPPLSETQANSRLLCLWAPGTSLPGRAARRGLAHLTHTSYHGNAALRPTGPLARPQCLECGGRGHVTFVPSTQLSPQVNQDYNHNSKERIVFVVFFFLKGVRAWKIQHTNETKCKKKYKKIENRKMYLQVVHYYDQKAQRRLLLQYMHQSRSKALQGRSLQKRKGPERFIFSSLICYTDHNQMRPRTPVSISVQILYWFLTARSVVEGKTAAYPCTRKPEKTALHANNHSEPVCYTA